MQPATLLDEPTLTPQQTSARAILDAYEGPSCHCFDGWDPERGPPPSCPHVQHAEHSLSPARWEQLQRDLLPEEYVDLDRPAAATAALPGREEKILVMMERIEHLESPCHPDDLRLEQCDEHIETHPVNAAGETAPERNGRVAQRKLALRSVKEDAKRWRCILPDGRVLDGVKVNTKAEARELFKVLLGIPRKGRLPMGTVVEEEE